MKTRVIHALALCFLLESVFGSGVFSQTSNPPALWKQQAEMNRADRPPRVLARNAKTWQESDSIWAAKQMPPSLSHGTSLSGVEWVKLDRGAVYNQPGEFIRVEAKWSTSVLIKGMRINTYTSSQPQLYDNGTHGDKVAGDGIWTLDSLSIYGLYEFPTYKWYQSARYGCVVIMDLPIEWQLSDGTWQNEPGPAVKVGFVDPLTTFNVQKLGPGLWATEYALFIEDSLQSQRVFPGFPATEKTWASDMKPASAIFYKYFPDSFDFLVVTPATTLWLPGSLCVERVPNQSGVKNDVEGIGLQKFDSTSAWGSLGKLWSVVYHSYGQLDILGHELGHTWMAYIDTLTTNNGGCGVHWAENQTIGGPLSLWPKVVETAPGVFRGETQNLSGDLDGLFSDLDLYLMGLKPLSEVRTIKKLNNPDYTNPDTVRYSSVTVFDPKTLLAKYGERRPAYPNAQHDFKMATIVVKPLGWTDAEFACFSIYAKYAADTLDDGFGRNYSFEKAANGLVSLDSKMFTPSGAPSVPVLDSPAGGATGQPTSVTLKWGVCQGASSFHLQVSMTSGFTDTLIEKTEIAGTSCTPLGLKQNTIYYWRVRALGSTGISQFSAPRSFSTSTGLLQPPTLATPADSARNESTTPTLSWNAVQGATSYHLQLSADRGFTVNIVNDSSISVTSKAVGPLSTATIYYWRVRAKVLGAYTSFSSSRSFSTSSSVVGPPPPPMLVAPADSARNESTNPTLSWNALPGATSYHLQLSTAPTFNVNIVDDSSITVTSRGVGPLSSATTYCWRVRAKIQGIYTSFSPPRSFSTSSSVVGTPPTLAAPADSARDVSTTPTLSWNAVQGATSYHLQLSGDRGFTVNIVNDSSITVTSKTVGPLSPGTVYCWRVRAKMQGGYTGFSLAQSFSTSPAVGQPPTLAGPPDNAGNVSITPTLSWNALPGATSYHLQLSVDSAFTKRIVDDSSITVSSKAVGPLSLATTYCWRVRARIQGSYSPFSPTGRFTTVRTTSIEQLIGEFPRDLELSQNYPNPFNPTTRFELRLPVGEAGFSNPEFVSLTVFDVLGRGIATLIHQTMSPGTYTVVWNGRTDDGRFAASGVYFFQLRAGGSVITKKMNFLH